MSSMDKKRKKSVQLVDLLCMSSTTEEMDRNRKAGVSLVNLHIYKQDWYFTNILCLYSLNNGQKEEEEAITCQPAQLQTRLVLYKHLFSLLF